MLLVVPPSSCLLSLLFPFSPSLPVIKLLYLTRSLHWWWDLKFEIGVSRLRIGVRLKDLEVVVLVDCLPGASLARGGQCQWRPRRGLFDKKTFSAPSQQREEGRLPQIQRHPSLPLPLLPPKAPKTAQQWNQSAVLSVSALCMYRRVGSCESDNVVKDKTGCQLFSQES